MTPELKAQWVAALRSGTYKQGRSQLCDSNKLYCCLGVLAEELGLLVNTPNGARAIENGRLHFNQTSLTGQVLDRVGLTYGMQHSLITLNDGSPHYEEGVGGERPHSFDEIADYIEEHL